MTGKLLEVGEIVQPDQDVELSTVFEVYHDEVPSDELQAAHLEILGQPNRKMFYTWPVGETHSDAPAAIERVAWYFKRNEILIPKRYGTEDDDDSAAYIEHGLHMDPEEYFSVLRCSKIELLTLGGFAVMLVQESEEGGLIAIALRPNTRVTLRENALHGVSRPLSLEALEYFCTTKELDESLGVPEPRTFLFGGRFEYGIDSLLTLDRIAAEARVMFGVGQEGSAYDRWRKAQEYGEWLMPDPRKITAKFRI